MLQVTCGDAVAEGTTSRVTLEGNNFIQATISVEANIGDIDHIVVENTQLVSFDYTAPSFPTGTLGPKTVTFTVTAGPGSSPSQCTIEIQLDPFIESCTTNYPPNTGAAPTTGVFAGQLTVATLTGGNFVGGGVLVVQTKAGFRLVEEVGALEPFTRPGQFRVINSTTLQLAVPDFFSVGNPTILDGNDNIGPAMINYVTPLGAQMNDDGCFSYVASFLDFEDFLFEVPGSVAGLGDVPGLSAPGKIAIGDVNNDGVPDVVMLAQQVQRADGAPEAILFLSNTFGPGIDRNGDGISPDFAGSFTTQIINHPDMQTLVPEEGRGQQIVLANLDDDPELEIVIPVVDEQGVDPLLLVDIEPGGVVGAMFVFYPPDPPEYTAGIAVGDFDHTSSEPDVAVLYGDSDPANRKLVIFRSQGPFDYVPTVHDIPTSLEEYRPGALGAGDFDRDGDDDLIWGQYDGGVVFPELRPIVIARVGAGPGTVGPPEVITNLSGSVVSEIDAFDANGDGRVDAIVYIGGEAQGTLTGDDHLGAGVAVFLDAFSLKADSFTETPYRFLFWDRAGNGRGLTRADFNGDGDTDLAVVNDFGEVMVLLGDGHGSFVSSGLTWQVVTGWTDAPGPVQSLDAADFDRDGLADIVVGDMSNPPFNLVYLLNASR